MGKNKISYLKQNKIQAIKKSKEEEYFIILKKLAETKHHVLQRKDFEIPKVKGKSISEELEKIPQKEDYIPHSTLITRLNELVENYLVRKYDSGLRSKRHLPIFEYDLTLFGLVKLLQLWSGKESLLGVWNAMTRLADILPYKRNLEEVFTKNQLTETLSQVCKNISIDIVKDPKKNGV